MIRIFPLLLICTTNLLHGGDPAHRLIEAAKAQIGVTVGYDGSYARIPYPGGDVPLDRGVCTDVLIRAYRKLGTDLQALVHQDMASHWDAYPNAWHMKGPDSNIDHRRVPNLATFFGRHGQILSIAKDPAIYLPGDVVTWRLSSGVPHIGIVSDQHSTSGVPLMIHNIGYGTSLDDLLFGPTITGHFRYFPKV